MIEKTLTVKFRFGICCRPACAIVLCSQKYRSAITFMRLDYIDRCASGCSIVEIMNLAASENVQLVCRIEGDDEQEAMAAITALFENDFGCDAEHF